MTDQSVNASAAAKATRDATHQMIRGSSTVQLRQAEMVRIVGACRVCRISTTASTVSGLHEKG
jgi:hypothetical protein